MIKKNLDSGRFTLEGFGPSEPVASSDNPVGDAQNRGLEVPFGQMKN